MITVRISGKPNIATKPSFHKLDRKDGTVYYESFKRDCTITVETDDRTNKMTIYIYDGIPGRRSSFARCSQRENEDLITTIMGAVYEITQR